MEPYRVRPRSIPLRLWNPSREAVRSADLGRITPYGQDVCFFAEENISLAFQGLKTHLRVIIRQDRSQMIDSAGFWIVFLARPKNLDTRAFSWSHCAHVCVFHA